MNFFRCSCLTLALAFLPMGFASGEPPVSPKGLELFFDLGLPDARAAKWVNTMSYSGMPPKFPDHGAGGNSWLLPPKEGHPSVILDQAQRVRLPKNSTPETVEGDDPTALVVEPADFGEDLTSIRQEVEKKYTEWKNRPTKGDYQIEEREGYTGRLLLFLAHLQRRGESKVVAELLPKALALMPSPELSVDCGVNVLADAKAGELADAWVSDRNTAAYLRGLEELLTTFDRGWKNRDGAALLVTRLKLSESTAPDSFETWLLGLSREQLALLQHENWLFPSPNSGEPMWKSQAESAGAFALRLAGLLKSNKLVPMPQQPRSFYSSSNEGQPRPEGQFDRMPRPQVLREFAASLLQRILPNDLQSMENDAEREAAVSWIESIAAESNPEAAAWAVMSDAEAHDTGFQNALAFLAEKGGEESLARLEEVFLDPAIWQNAQSIARIYKEYANRRPSPERSEKILKIVRKGVEEQQAQYRSHAPGRPDSDQEKYFKMQLRELEQMIKPSDPKEQLDRLATTTEVSDEEIRQELLVLLRTSPEVASLLIQKAAATTDPRRRQLLLNPLRSPNPSGVTFSDDASKQALLTLLNDKNSSEIVANLVVRHMPEFDPRSFGERFSGDADLINKWSLKYALATAKGETPPAIPEAEKMDPKQLEELVARLGTLPVPDLLKEIDSLPIERHLALLKDFQNRETLPPVFQSLARLVQNVTLPDDFPDEMPKSWKGRTFDASLRTEIEAWLAKRVHAGEILRLAVSELSKLRGLRIVLFSLPNTQGVNQEAFQLPNHPKPIGAVIKLVADPANRTPPSIAGYPLWNETDLSAAWFAYRKGLDEPPAFLEGAQSKPMENQDFEKIAEEFSTKPGGRILLWFACTFSEKSEADSATPSDPPTD